MDQRDALIIHVIERSVNTLSSRAIAQKTELPISTVYRRIQKLEEAGVIAGYKALINYEKTDRPIATYVFINLAEITPDGTYIPKQEVVEKLKSFKEIHELTDVQGQDFNLILMARFSTLKELSRFTEELRSLKGIEELSTAIITEEIMLQ
jgi:Lrp/AsnC family leucine-responsive transcriptional regulator